MSPAPCGWPIRQCQDCRATGSSAAAAAQHRQGTANTVLWNLGYDPIVHAAQKPTYVDDLSGLAVGVEQTLRLHYFLLAAGHAANLSVKTHRCVLLVAAAAHPAVDRALDTFPMVNTRTPTSWTRAGLPPQTLDAIGQTLVGGQWA
eukprot:8639562-Lingulodinium_polyedra.AAC.1